MTACSFACELDVLTAPLFHPMVELCEHDARDILYSDFKGTRVGHGAESVVRLSPHPAYVIKTMKEGHEPSLAQEHKRLKKLPKFSFFPQFHAKLWDKCLMPCFLKLRPDLSICQSFTQISVWPFASCAPITRFTLTSTWTTSCSVLGLPDSS